MKLYTAQYHYRGSDRLDITTRATQEGRVFQPEISWVMDYKTGRMTEEQYTRLYTRKMENSIIRYAAEWVNVVIREEVTFVCFCKAGDFCHRLLLKDIFLKEYGQFVTYRGERNLIKGGIY